MGILDTLFNGNSRNNSDKIISSKNKKLKDIRHDLKNIAGSIMGFASLIQKDNKDSNGDIINYNLEERLDKIKKGAEKIILLSEELKKL